MLDAQRTRCVSWKLRASASDAKGSWRNDTHIWCIDGAVWWVVWWCGSRYGCISCQDWLWSVLSWTSLLRFQSGCFLLFLYCKLNWGNTWNENFALLSFFWRNVALSTGWRCVMNMTSSLMLIPRNLKLITCGVFSTGAFGLAEPNHAALIRISITRLTAPSCTGDGLRRSPSYACPVSDFHLLGWFLFHPFNFPADISQK